MRIRSTKPEFWRSKRIASVSWEARLVLKGLESYVDDNGVGKDDLEMIAGDIFSRDLARESSRTLARVSEAISLLHQAGLVWRYEVEGESLLYLSFWDQTQRVDKPQSGRFRRPDGTLDYKESVIGESFANPRESSRILAPVTGEQGNRGTGEIVLTSQPSVTRASRTMSDEGKAALRIVHAWEHAQPDKVPLRTLNDVTAQIQQFVVEGIDPDRIAMGLAEWWEGKYPPSTLANYVAKAGRTKTATGTNRAKDTLEIVRQLEMEENGEPF